MLGRCAVVFWILFEHVPGDLVPVHVPQREPEDIADPRCRQLKCVDLLFVCCFQRVGELAAGYAFFPGVLEDPANGGMCPLRCRSTG